MDLARRTLQIFKGKALHFVKPCRMSLPDWNGRAKFSDFLSAQTIGEAVAGSGDSLFFLCQPGFYSGVSPGLFSGFGKPGLAVPGDYGQNSIDGKPEGSLVEEKAATPAGGMGEGEDDQENAGDDDSGNEW